ncbi:hypothetical protein D3C83_38060 [compost metagenome]
MLARFERVFCKDVVRRHPHRHERRFDLRVGVHRLVVAVGARHAELLGCRLRRVGVRRADGVERDLRQSR